MKWLHMVTFTLVIIGALNWGLLSIFDFNIVSTIFGFAAGLENFVYASIGFSALWIVFKHKNDCKTCSSKE